MLRRALIKNVRYPPIAADPKVRFRRLCRLWRPSNDHSRIAAVRNDCEGRNADVRNSVLFVVSIRLGHALFDLLHVLKNEVELMSA